MVANTLDTFGKRQFFDFGMEQRGKKREIGKEKRGNRGKTGPLCQKVLVASCFVMQSVL